MDTHPAPYLDLELLQRYPVLKIPTEATTFHRMFVNTSHGGTIKCVIQNITKFQSSQTLAFVNIKNPTSFL
jgi:hypothetical protein